MKSALVAGATGYLGKHLVQELKRRNYRVRALVRKESQKKDLQEADEIFVGQITQPQTLRGITEGVDVVLSSIGITRQRDGMTYNDVDYQGNLNLLQEAEKTGVERFLYVSVFGAEKLHHLQIIRAKEHFVEALKSSPVPHSIVRPTGFFADLKEVLDMARKGRVYLVGQGEYESNPISGRDLASACADALEEGREEVHVGGPRVYTQEEIAQGAFEALQTRERITHIPEWMANGFVTSLKLLTPSTVYGPIEFFASALTTHMVAPTYGHDDLLDFFQKEASSA